MVPKYVLKRVLVIKKPSDDLSTQIFLQIVPVLARRGIEIIVDPSVSVALSNPEKYPDLPPLQCYDATKLDQLAETLDLIISIGGDGTLLHISQLFPGYCPLILPINTGSLGFLTPFSVTEVWKALAMVISGKFEVTERSRFVSTVYRSWVPGSKRATPPSPDDHYYCLNEIVVDRGYSSYISKLETYVDDNLITVVQGDGLIVSTSTGSTAYSLSASGPIVHPCVPSIICTPICPHSLSFRPLVLPKSANVTVRVAVGSRSTAWVSFDSRSRLELAEGDAVTTRLSEFNLKSVAKESASSDFFCSLTELLGWNRRPIQKPLSQVAQILDTRQVLSSLPAAPADEEELDSAIEKKIYTSEQISNSFADALAESMNIASASATSTGRARSGSSSGLSTTLPPSSSATTGATSNLYHNFPHHFVSAMASRTSVEPETVNKGIDILAKAAVVEESFEFGHTRSSAVARITNCMIDHLLEPPGTADTGSSEEDQNEEQLTRKELVTRRLDRCGISSEFDPKVVHNVLAEQLQLLVSTRKTNAFLAEIATLLEDVQDYITSSSVCQIAPEKREQPVSKPGEAKERDKLTGAETRQKELAKKQHDNILFSPKAMDRDLLISSDSDESIPPSSTNLKQYHREPVLRGRTASTPEGVLEDVDEPSHKMKPQGMHVKFAPTTVMETPNEVMIVRKHAAKMQTSAQKFETKESGKSYDDHESLKGADAAELEMPDVVITPSVNVVEGAPRTSLDEGMEQSKLQQSEKGYDLGSCSTTETETEEVSQMSIHSDMTTVTTSTSVQDASQSGVSTELEHSNDDVSNSNLSNNTEEVDNGALDSQSHGLSSTPAVGLVADDVGDVTAATDTRNISINEMNSSSNSSDGLYVDSSGIHKVG